MPRLYGRKGFTTKKTVSDLLGPYERPPAADDPTRIPFERLPADTAVNLIGKLPKAQQNDRSRDDAPTLADLTTLALSIDAQLAGYRVLDDQLDERITFTRITIPHDALNHELVAALAAGIPDPTALTIGPDGSAYAAWE